MVGKKVTTNVIKKTLNPKWGKQNFILYVFLLVLPSSLQLHLTCRPIPAEATHLVFHAYDHDDVGKDDEMGMLTLQIKTLPLDYKVFSRCALVSCAGHSVVFSCVP